MPTLTPRGKVAEEAVEYRGVLFGREGEVGKKAGKISLLSNSCRLKCPMGDPWRRCRGSLWPPRSDMVISARWTMELQSAPIVLYLSRGKSSSRHLLVDLHLVTYHDSLQLTELRRPSNRAFRSGS